jgi:hypothetical protein
MKKEKQELGGGVKGKDAWAFSGLGIAVCFDSEDVLCSFDLVWVSWGTLGLCLQDIKNPICLSVGQARNVCRVYDGYRHNTLLSVELPLTVLHFALSAAPQLCVIRTVVSYVVMLLVMLYSQNQLTSPSSNKNYASGNSNLSIFALSSCLASQRDVIREVTLPHLRSTSF